MERICGEVCRELRKRYAIVYTSDKFDYDLERFVRTRRLDFVAYSNADFRYVRQLPLEQVRGFHLVRDPRDIVVSAYFSHRNSHPTHAWPELVKHRERLLACSKEAGLFLEMEFRAEQLQEMLSWRDFRHGGTIRLVRMEDATARPYDVLLDLFDHLGLLEQEEFTPGRRIAYLASKACRRIEYLTGNRVTLPLAPARLPAERFLGIIWQHEFQRLAGGRVRGTEDANHHYRKGQPGDWRNHFTSEHVDYFKERYNELLVTYGYERDANWDIDVKDEEFGIDGRTSIANHHLSWQGGLALAGGSTPKGEDLETS